MALREESWHAIKTFFWIFSVLLGPLPFYLARKFLEMELTRATVIIIALICLLPGVAVYCFYLRLPYPSRYTSTVIEKGAWFQRSHLKDVFAMAILGSAAGVFIVACFKVIW
ncbi:MAG: hypothetical protein JW943_09185 [Deltaproteobacteria bacterium]|nr:hypothetical protein [Deltaproteobacteria bacterium]